MAIPSNLRYTREHEWILVNGNTGTIGVTDFAQTELGDVVYIEVTNIDERVSGGDPFGSIEAVKTVSDLFAPITGVVTDFNEDLETQPELVNQDPYGRGWIIKMQIENIVDVDSLLTPQQYDDYVKSLK